MATPHATNRLTKEYKTIYKSPPPYIVAHPSESNILEWHYIITGPPETPYEGGQYWGTLMFPPDYPYAPPAIRMHTPSGRFQPSTRLCLSISDFHPKSFNPAWEVSTILTGLLSFMTSEEMTTGSVRASEQERKLFARRTRWWNSTGGGSNPVTAGATHCSNSRGIGGIKAGDGGAKFRAEWPEVDEENFKWMKEKRIDLTTGLPRSTQSSQPHCSPDVAGLRRRPGASATVVQDAQIARDAGQGWVSRNRWKLLFGTMFLYILTARALGDGAITSTPVGGH
ncbi:ubiquitin-conjugating enzyme/RWD-like protein [Phaeosphaeriaceae sp. PMI808]|nr:ubiquitin-conjugating enzyme/RWD-like protein [Phaeosphaeriaceae sp. PMI808]